MTNLIPKNEWTTEDREATEWFEYAIACMTKENRDV